MPHYSVIKTELVDRDYLLQAINGLGYTYRQAINGFLHVRGLGGRWHRVEIQVITNIPGYDIGFVKINHVYEIIADWWGIHTLSRQDFVRRLTQCYAYHKIVAEMKEQGFVPIDEELKKGEIHLFWLERALLEKINGYPISLVPSGKTVVTIEGNILISNHEPLC